MITFIRIVRSLLSFVIQTVAWVLFVLGLWLPCLFALVFLIVCAFSGTSLSDVAQIFIVGLIVSAVGGIAIAYYLDKRKRENAQVVRLSKKDEKRKEKENKKKAADGEKNKGREKTGQEPMPEPQPSARPMTFPEVGYSSPEPSPMQSFSEPQSEPQQEFNEPPRMYDYSGESDNVMSSNAGSYEFGSEMRRKYFDEKAAAQSGGYDYEGGAKRRLDRINSDDEQPLIFRSRLGSDVYIYEYSDRLEYYRRTFYGMLLLDVRAK